MSVTENQASHDLWKVGARVSHPQYGLGWIVSFQPRPGEGEPLAVIDFDNGEHYRKFIISKSQLRVVSYAGKHRPGYLWEERRFPQEGWDHLYVNDHGEPGFVCEFCGNPEVRYEHVLGHPNWSFEVGVGCVCAGYLIGYLEIAIDRERQARNRANRRSRWAHKNWKVSKKGNPWKTSKGRHVVVFPSHGRWYASIDGFFSPSSFASEDEAKIAVFDCLFSNEDDEP